MKVTILTGLAVLALFSSTAQARHDDGYRDTRAYRQFEPEAGARIDIQQQRQRRLIADAWRRGELNSRELRRLEDEQRRIRQKERLYLSDGVLRPAERADLRRDLAVALQHIQKERHDRQRRY